MFCLPLQSMAFGNHNNTMDSENGAKGDRYAKGKVIRFFVLLLKRDVLKYRLSDYME